jgi:YMGG-like Gly-zipper
MRGKLLMAGFALAVFLPSAASAQETCEERASNRVAGTAIGAVAGALLGAGVAGHHEKGTGAVIGGLAGALVGSQLTKGPPDCRHAYGWYDNGGRWHTSAVAPGEAYGYYDRSGSWVEGQPADYRPAPPPPPPQRVDWDDRGYDEQWRDWPGYPEFRGQEARIREHIREGVREDMIAPEDAHDLMVELREIRAHEYREFQEYGWRLPYDDGARIHERLARLDHRVDEIRDER